MIGVREGDMVTIRSWDSMVNEYGTFESHGRTVCSIPCKFTLEMRELFCKKSIRVTEFWRAAEGKAYFRAEIQPYAISPEMIVGNPNFGG